MACTMLGKNGCVGNVFMQGMVPFLLGMHSDIIHTIFMLCFKTKCALCAKYCRRFNQGGYRNGVSSAWMEIISFYTQLFGGTP